MTKVEVHVRSAFAVAEVQRAAEQNLGALFLGLNKAVTYRVSSLHLREPCRCMGTSNALKITCCWTWHLVCCLKDSVP